MLLIVAAFSQELSGLPGLVTSGAPGVRWQASAMLRGGRAVLAANGAGRAAAAVAVRAMLERFECQSVVSAGHAGALDPALEIGDIVLAESVRHVSGEFPALLPTHCPAAARRGTLLTVDEVVGTARAKRSLARAGALAVDMEAAAVAAVAAERGLGFYCVRSISDRAGTDLPVDFNLALRGDGTLSPWSVTRQAGLRAGAWARLLDLWRDAHDASRSLARCLARCEFRP